MVSPSTARPRQTTLLKHSPYSYRLTPLYVGFGVPASQPNPREPHMQTTASTSHQHQPDDFDQMATAVRARFDSVKHQQLFTVDAGDLFSAYLIGLADDQRQIHNCNCCRRFIQAFGNVVTIDTDGITSPAFWTLADVPEMYQDSMRAMFRAVSNGKVTGVFLSADKAYGKPTEGGWSHFAAVPARVHADCFLTLYQGMAAKREGFGTLSR